MNVKTQLDTSLFQTLSTLLRRPNFLPIFLLHAQQQTLCFYLTPDTVCSFVHFCFLHLSVVYILQLVHSSVVPQVALLLACVCLSSHAALLHIMIHFEGKMGRYLTPGISKAPIPGGYTITAHGACAKLFFNTNGGI